jgi:hypothetical protein
VGNGYNLEKREQAQNLYVVRGITRLAMIESLTGVSRRTLSDWKEKYDWEKKRADYISQPEEINIRLKRVVNTLLDDIDEILDTKDTLKQTGKKDDEEIPFLGVGEKVSELGKVVHMLAKIDGMFYSKGVMLRFLDLFTEFAATQNEPAFIKSLGKLAPRFIDYMEVELR